MRQRAGFHLPGEVLKNYFCPHYVFLNLRGKGILSITSILLYETPCPHTCDLL
jgi:hypothetical protein